MTAQNTRRGILLMIATTIVFAAQDGVSRHLGSEYSIFMVVMIRFWFFALFVTALAAREAGGIRAATRTQFPLLQVARGLVLVTQVCVMVLAFVKLGLIESHAVFASYPLIIAALSGPILGERVGWRRWAAIGIGFVGVLIMLQPGSGVFSPWAIVPLVSAVLFALYGLLTRYVARKDAASVSFFWTGIVGAVGTTAVGVWFWEPMTPTDWIWMLTLCCSAILAHRLLIQAYAVAEASAVQPFAYLQLIFVAAIGILVFDEALRANVLAGGLLVVAAGLFTLWRQRIKGQEPVPPAS